MITGMCQYFKKFLFFACLFCFVPLYAYAQGISSQTQNIISIDGLGFNGQINTNSEKTLLFVTTYDYPPFVYVRRDGHLGGLDIELARHLCRLLQQKACELQQLPHDQIGNALLEGKADIGIAGLRMSKTLEDQLDFTEPYLRQAGRFVVRTSFAGSPFTKDNVAGIRVGVTAGTMHERFIQTNFPNAVVFAFPEQNDARKALKGRQIDAVFDDAMSLSFWLNGQASENCCKYLDEAYLNTEYFGDGLALAVKDGETDLVIALNSALARMARDGLLSSLYLKYFPISFM